MAKQRHDIESLVQDIKTLSVAEKTKSASVALLNLIPYAGGAVASVVGEIATQRKFEKICDVLSDLNSKLESHKANPEEHLSRDQIIEVVHETLQTVTTASDEWKIAALKNGLGYAFLSEDSFERKQLFLQVLRAGTSLELVVLRAIYNSSDPYIVHQESLTRLDIADLDRGIASIASSIISTHGLQNGFWRPVGNKDSCGQPPLLTFLAERIGFDEGATKGAARLLDGKGLADLGPNLRKSHCKVVSWVQTPSGASIAAPVYANNVLVAPRIELTPMEASRTKFGEDFLRFCRGY